MHVCASFALTEDSAVFSFNNKYQGRFYAPNLTINNKKYFVDFSYVWTRIGDYNDFQHDCVKDIKIGYYLNRSTGEYQKSHIWIKDLETAKRAGPEVYGDFLSKLQIWIGFDRYDELHVEALTNQIEFSEKQ